MGTPSSKNKRQDLQGIRGFAIISVLGFHFLPSLFPNGYLGVDQFFVLSGFLMCMLLRRCSSSSIGFSWLSLIFEFYSKRLKRLLPLYLVIIFISILSLFYIFPKTAYETNLESAGRALLFVSNRAATQAEDYFAMLAIAIDIFTHTWSLSVEVQFYLIVPFIFLLGIKAISNRFQVHYYTFIGLISYGYSLFFCSKSEAFNSVFARIWQFMIGMIVFVLTEIYENYENSLERMTLLDEPSREDAEKWNKKYQRYIKNLILAAMILCVFYPKEIDSEFLRLLLTVSTGILMLVSQNDSILSFSILSYIGDFSYSLYLIHWPIYAYWKLELSAGAIWNSYLIGAFTISIFLGVFSYEFFEKWYLRLSGNTVTVMCTVLFLLNSLTLHHDRIEKLFVIEPPRNFARLDGIVMGNGSFDQAKKLNEDWSLNDYQYTKVPTCKYEDEVGPFGRCTHTGLEKNHGKHKIMIIGNSLAANHARVIYQECGRKAKSLIQISIRGCEPLYPSSYAGQRCIDTVEMFKKIMPEEKPDYVFLMSRFLDIGNPLAKGVNRVEDDPIYKGMKTTFDIFAKSVQKKMFVFTQMPEIRPASVDKIVDVVRNGKDLTQFDKSFVLVDHKMAQKRYNRLIDDCEKCVPISYDSLFWNTTTNTWRFYDVENNGLSYVSSIKHLSFHGLELVRHIFTDICNKL